MIYVVEVAIILICLFKVKKSIKSLITNKTIIAGLAVNDLKLKYAGSALGILWAFVQPALTTFIYWFVFQLGFKSQPVANFPFILWLISGLTPWFYFGETVTSGTGTMQEYTYLVKKVLFSVEILPVIKTIATFIVHMMFIGFVCLMFLLNGVGLTVYVFQLVYYSLAMLILATGFVYLFSALQVFLRDTIQIISAMMQLVFWSVPIVWDIGTMPEMIQRVLKLNPLFYIVEGYRDSFINQIWFWEKMPETVYFWCVALGMFTLGITVFKRLSPHFADVM